MRDLIDRQAAIDAVEFGITYAKAINKETGEVKELFQASNDELRKAEDRIKQLPSAQPNLQPTCNQLATDCISRQAAIEELQAWWDNPDDGRSSRQVMMQLPSAQRTGRWIVVDEQEPRRYGCSECKRLVWQIENYCPNCGCAMKGEEE